MKKKADKRKELKESIKMIKSQRSDIDKSQLINNGSRMTLDESY